MVRYNSILNMNNFKAGVGRIYSKFKNNSVPQLIIDTFKVSIHRVRSVFKIFEKPQNSGKKPETSIFT